MEIPKPKFELKAFYGHVATNPYFMEVHYSSEKARQWLLNVLPQFTDGDKDFYSLAKESLPNNQYLSVSRCFDVKEVADYINSWNVND